LLFCLPGGGELKTGSNFFYRVDGYCSRKHPVLMFIPKSGHKIYTERSTMFL
jgi:hypothetical protein